MSGENNVQKAMDWLADTPDGAVALKGVADAGEALRGKLPVKLSNGELKYVLSKLWSQRSADGWTQNAHFDIQPVAANAIGVAAANLPANLAVVKRVRNLGFMIRASIPAPSF